MSKPKFDFWMPIYIGDLLADTQHLTDEQFGKYHKLLYHQWRHGHFSEEEMFAIAGFSGSVFEDALGASSTLQAAVKQTASRCLAPIKQMLSQDQDGLWFSRRCDLEKTQWFEKKRVFTERARKGGIAKEKRRQEKLAEMAASSSALTSASGVLDECYSPKEQVQKQIPSPPTAPRGPREDKPEVLQAPSPLLQAAPAIGPSQELPAAVPAGAGKENVNKAKQSQDDAKARPNGAIDGNVQAAQNDRVAVVGTSGARGFISASQPENATPAGDDPKSVSKAKLMAAMKAEIFRFWAAAGVEEYECPWSELEDRALNRFVKENPSVDLPRFKQLLRNRAASEGINRADPPRKWLRSLVKYAHGPLDRFGKPLKPARAL